MREEALLRPISREQAEAISADVAAEEELRRVMDHDAAPCALSPIERRLHMRREHLVGLDLLVAQETIDALELAVRGHHLREAGVRPRLRTACNLQETLRSPGIPKIGIGKFSIYPTEIPRLALRHSKL